MSAEQSALTRYGYDFVLALTQVGMNEKLKPALGRVRAPDRYFCVFKGASSCEVYSLDQMTARLNGVDPFSLPNGANSKSNASLEKLVDAGLLFVIHSRIGSYTLPRSEIDIVSFTGHAASVTYNLLFAAFEVGQIVTPASPDDGSEWHVVAQTREQPWFFAVKAGLAIEPLADMNQWPPAVLTESRKYQSCTVSRVAFQLSDAEILAYPVIPGLEAGSSLHEALRLSVQPQAGQDTANALANVIGYWVRPNPPSYSVVTAMNHVVSPYRQDWDGNWNGPPPPLIVDPTVDQANAATLDLLCAVNNDSLPAPQPFRWNWLTARPLQSHHGVIAVNAATFAAYLRTQLDEHASVSCWQPVVRADRAQIVINGGATPSVRTMTGKNVVLEYTFAARASDAAYGVQIALSTSYTMQVEFNSFYLWPTPTAATTITIRQRSVIFLDVTKGSENIPAYIVDYTLFQEFPLAIDANGQLTVQSPRPADKVINDSQTIELVQTDLSLQWLQAAADNITNAAQKYALPGSVTPSIVTNFFFPFGDAFSFADVSFSKGLDLYGHINFAAGTG
jgi:hypothetical protein